ncbi:hypothetical protein [Amycolatopsis sp. cg9]|uniref:hypothetical protein n=1 Tax=Amycolatopsis sp. cg9 TaxID=3238801 RepID=UPI0035254DA8
MTAIDERARPLTPPPPLSRWEWHLFDADRWAHLYAITELVDQRLDLLLPWCLRRAPYPLEHDRASIEPSPLVMPQRIGTGVCPVCLTHSWASIPHPRSGTLLAGGFVGDLAEVVIPDAIGPA